jgi:hypothetical protein
MYCPCPSTARLVLPDLPHYRVHIGVVPDLGELAPVTHGGFLFLGAMSATAGRRDQSI